jgi:hypothetical protein
MNTRPFILLRPPVVFASILEVGTFQAYSFH